VKEKINRNGIEIIEMIRHMVDGSEKKKEIRFERKKNIICSSYFVKTLKVCCC